MSHLKLNVVLRRHVCEHIRVDAFTVRNELLVPCFQLKAELLILHLYGFEEGLVDLGLMEAYLQFGICLGQIYLSFFLKSIHLIVEFASKHLD